MGTSSSSSRSCTEQEREIRNQAGEETCRAADFDHELRLQTDVCRSLMTIEFFATVVLSCVTMVHAHLYCVLLSVDVLHCLHNTTACGCARRIDGDYQFGSMCVCSTQEKGRQLLVFFLSFVLSSFCSTSEHILHACLVRCLPLPVFNSMREQEQSHFS